LPAQSLRAVPAGSRPRAVRRGTVPPVSPQGATFRRVPYHLLSADPVPIWYIEDGHKPSIGDEPVLALHQALQPVNGKRWIAFRGKPIDRLGGVMANGVDVDPTDTPIFCAEEDKAYEYAKPEWGGKGPGLMYALHGGYLERSFRMLPADASPEDIAEVRKTYPHQYDSPHDGFYFSRLADQSNTAYEYAYGYWIPGNAKDALLAIFLRGTVNEVMEALTPHVTDVVDVGVASQQQH
jgi:hypothetical protein